MLCTSAPLKGALDFTVTISTDEILDLIHTELATVSDSRVVQHVCSLLVKPHVVLRQWDYGKELDSYPCWSVFEHRWSNTSISYSEFGFGPAYPWGLVSIAGSKSDMSMGMDSSWFPIFVETYFESKAVYELPIWRVFRRSGYEDSGQPITAESDYDSTWDEVTKLRESDKSALYYCSHSIEYKKSEI